MWFVNGYGFLHLRLAGCWKIVQFSTPHISTDFDAGHGMIKRVSPHNYLRHCQHNGIIVFGTRKHHQVILISAWQPQTQQSLPVWTLYWFFTWPVLQTITLDGALYVNHNVTTQEAISNVLIKGDNSYFVHHIVCKGLPWCEAKRLSNSYAFYKTHL